VKIRSPRDVSVGEQQAVIAAGGRTKAGGAWDLPAQMDGARHCLLGPGTREYYTGPLPAQACSGCESNGP